MIKLKTVGILTAAVLLIFASSCYGKDLASDKGNESGEIDWSFYNDRAEQLVAQLAEGEYGAVAKTFDEGMAKALSADALKQAWEGTVEQAGDFSEIIKTENLTRDSYYICLVTSKHEKKGVITRVVFSQDGQVSGLFFSFTENLDNLAGQRQPPEGVTEIPIVIGEGTEFPLDGILSMPDRPDAPGTTSANRKYPAVILVHGSGPSDMNETVYGISVFEDIADYLAQHDIAVLRYDKRTYTYGAEFVTKYGNDYTVWEETIDDAIKAKVILTADERIDTDRIYVLGHSLGGMLAPRITEEGDFAGAIILAGSPRSLLDIIYDQNMYSIGLMGLGDKERTSLIAQVEASRKQYFGLSEKYIKEMDEHPARNYLSKTDKPFLILQGGKDFQVYPDIDFEQYKEITKGQSNIECKLYPNLNHLFTVSIMETPTTDDYVSGSQVDQKPLADIVAWLRTWT